MTDSQTSIHTDDSVSGSPRSSTADASEPITACPLCGAVIQTTQVFEAYTTDVKIRLDGNSYDILDYTDVEWGAHELTEERIYCKNDHSLDEMRAALA